ncbi:MAG: PAS domain-containing protein [bacterium]|nr:PAS domain-containing protein [bacterium]
MKTNNSLIWIWALFVILLLTGSTGLFSFQCGQPAIKLEPVYSDNALSMLSVHCIIQDHRGFIWIATQNGLNKYDGYGYTVYNHKAFDDNTLSDNYILTMQEDFRGILWIGTRSGGLNRFDWKTESFRSFKHDPSDPTTLSNNYVCAVHKDSRGRLWVGTLGGGLNRMNPTTMEFTHYRFNASVPGSIGSDSVLCIHEDPDGVLWLGTDGGLNRFEAQTGTFTRFATRPGDPAGLAGSSVRTIFRDHSGVMWLGTTAGLEMFIEKENRFTLYNGCDWNKQGLNIDPERDIVTAIVEDKNHRLWVGTGSANTIGNGLYILDKKRETFSPAVTFSPGNLANTSVTSLYKDNVDTLWIGCINKGILKYDSQRNKFTHCLNADEPERNVTGSDVWALHEDSEGDLWIGTVDGGLLYSKKNSLSYLSFSHNPEDPATLAGSAIRSLAEDKQGFIWVGMDKGLDRIEKKNRKITHVPFQPTAEGYPVSDIMIDAGDNAWIATWGAGFYKRDNQTGGITGFRHDAQTPNSLAENNISCITEDKTGILWIGTSTSGIEKYNRKTGTFTHFKHEPGNRNSLASGSIMGIHIDRHGMLWLATWGGGLNKLDPSNGSVTIYSEIHDLADDALYGIMEDSKNNLWISSVHGISRFNPGEETFFNYSPEDGLMEKGFNMGAFHIGRSGRMYFGGTNGFSSFMPSDITPNKNTPPVVLTDFKIFGKPVKPGTGEHRLQRISPGHVRIHLDNSENHFSLEFAALDYTNSRNNQYAYKMEGFDQGWIYCGNRRHADYTNLDGGTYIFRVIGSNNDRVWNQKGISVHITITPTLWNTLWFRVLVVLLIFLIVILPLYIRAKRFRVEIRHGEQSKKVLERSNAEFRKARKLMEMRHAEVLKLVESISSILIAIDVKGKIYQWNESAEDFFEIPRSMVMNKKFDDALKNHIEKNNLQAILQAGEKRSTSEMEVEVNFKDRTRLLLVTINPILDQTNQKLGLLMLCKDITDRRVREARTNLFLKLKSIGQMHVGISHEINTPIQYIRINSKIITDFCRGITTFYEKYKRLLDNAEGKEEKALVEKLWKLFDDAKGEEHLKKGTEATEMIKEGINRVLEVTKAMKEVFHPGREQKEFTDINKLLSATLIVSRYHIRQYAEIVTRLDKELPMTYCYPAQLNQVFLNLISNAADAVKDTGERGTVTIACSRDDSDVIIEISDTGTGIPDEYYEKVFMPYFTTKSLAAGTGQGLSLAKKIIEENHKGRLSFKSILGEGTSFYIRIPLEQ